MTAIMIKGSGDDSTMSQASGHDGTMIQEFGDDSNHDSRVPMMAQ